MNDTRTLVPFASHHVGSRATWLNDPRVLTGVPVHGEISVESTMRWYQRVSEDASRHDFVLEDTVSGSPLVMCGVTSIDVQARRGELYMFADPDRHGQGHGSQAMFLLCGWAFHQAQLNRLFLFTMGSNKDARRFYERNGFRHEGCLREHEPHEGALEDRHIHGLLRAEWQAL